jgi:autophagy-related protein 9
MWNSSIFYTKNIYETNNYYLKSSFINKLYKYYINRGYFNIIALQLVNILTTTFLVLFSIFLYNCIDYHILVTMDSKTHIDEVVNLGNFFNLIPILWFILITLGIFIVLKTICLIDDILVYRNIKFFYNKILEINDNDIQTMYWVDIIEVMKKKYGDNASFDIYYMVNRITNKNNYFIAMLDNRVFEISHLTGLMEWNIIFCILNFLFTEEAQINKAIFTKKQYYLEGIQKRLRIISLLNFIFMPFILLFILLYNIFNYGESFYNKPESLVLRNYTRMAYWKFRNYNELEHNYEDRLYKSQKHASSYLNQFSNKMLDTFSRLLVFIVSSFFIVFTFFSIINQNVLISLYIDGNKNVLWYIGLCVSIIAIFRNFITSQLVYHPEEKMVELNKYIYLPGKWIQNPQLISTKNQFVKYYPYKIADLGRNVVYTLLTPFQLWSLSFDVEHILDFIIKSTIEEHTLGFVCKYSLFNKNLLNSNEVKIVQSYDTFIKTYPDWKEKNLCYNSEYTVSYLQFPDLF